MSDQPADPPPPRVDVRLPDGRTVPGRLHGWQQGDDGRWWALALVQVPAGAIGQVDGEDYTAVPRKPAGTRYLLTTDDRTKPGAKPVMTLHKATCWTLDEKATWLRITPVADADQAEGMLRFPDTGRCEFCKPAP